MPEYPMLRHYLDLIADLPWDKSSSERIDIKTAREVTKSWCGELLLKEKARPTNQGSLTEGLGLGTIDLLSR
jgi:hypothetical protein